MTPAISFERDGAQVMPLPVAAATPVASVQGTLALDLGPRLEVPEPDLPHPGIGARVDVVLAGAGFLVSKYWIYRGD